MKKNIEMSLEQARTYYKESNDVAFKNMLEENFGKENLISITWESLKTINGYYIDSCSAIRRETNLKVNKVRKNLFATENQAKSCLAMAQLSQLMLVYNGDWVPNRTDLKFSISYDMNNVGNNLCITQVAHMKEFLVFKTYKTAEKFMREQNDLIKEYYNF